jgi:hypothetical protein
MNDPFSKERAASLKDMEYYRKSMTSKERQMELFCWLTLIKDLLKKTNK